MNQTWKNDKNPSFRIDLGPFRPNLCPKTFFPQFYFYYMLDIVTSYGSMQFQGKLMNQTWENSGKPSFRTDFGPVSPNLDSKIFFINFTYTKC